MKMLDRLRSFPRRWRNSHGFGVHSPFAFHFITKVLRDKHAVYYAYAEIDSFCPRARRAGFNEIFAGKDMSVPEARMLFRVLCHFNPDKIVEVGHGHEVTNIIIERSVPAAAVVTWHDTLPAADCESREKGPFVLVNQCNADSADKVAGMIGELLESGNAVIYVRNLHTVPANRRIWKSLLGNRTSGMAFFDSYTGIFVARSGLPFQKFELML